MKIVVDRANAKGASAFIKGDMPEFYGVIKDLYDAGMIQGLRGITIETITPEADQALALTLNKGVGAV